MIGKFLAHYEVTAELGRGGMGEVYRARDTKLGREIALKLLPPALSTDEERVARFEREARALASLQHANIASIFGFEEAEGVRFLVMELVEGEDLSQRLERGPLDVGDTIQIAKQMAAGLEAAHERGIVHRDLKPANVKITPERQTKILDFGLARAYQGDADASVDPLRSPTITAAMTQEGTILGTAAYMSPEQARGNPVDARADVWAFGCVVLECLTGRRLFEGASISDVLAAVLRDPVDWDQLPRRTPPALRRLLRRCLEREPSLRLHSLADARLDLEDAARELSRGITGSDEENPGGRIRRALQWFPWVATAALSLAVVLLLTRDSGTPSHSPVLRFAIGVDSLETSLLCPPAISPDGLRLVYSASGFLWVRDLDDLTPHRLEGTQGARLAFWSPDGTQIGFQAHHRLWRVSAGGGTPVVISETSEDFGSAGGVAWSPDGRIVYSTGDSGIRQVLISEGTAKPLLEPDPDRDDDFHQPSLLPDGRSVLFVPHLIRGSSRPVELFHDGKRRTVWDRPGENIEYPVYASGHLLFYRSRPSPGIWAIPFSLDALRVEGEPFLIADKGEVPSVSETGTLVYTRKGGGEHRLLRVETDGAVSGESLLEANHIDDAALSPSGTRLLALVTDSSAHEVLVRDLVRGTRSVVASGSGVVNPFWISESSIGAVYSDSARIVIHDLDSALPPRTLFQAKGGETYQRQYAPPTLTADRRHLVFVLHGADTTDDIWITSVEGGGGDAKPLLATPAREGDPQPSPATDLLAYVSDESGLTEVYLTRFAPGSRAASRRWQVSSNGGAHPRWDAAGKNLYYESEGRMMAVDVDTADGLRLGRPRVLFDLERLQLELAHGFDFDPHRSSFLMVQAGDPNLTSRDIIVVQNWLEEFRPSAAH